MRIQLCKSRVEGVRTLWMIFEFDHPASAEAEGDTGRSLTYAIASYVVARRQTEVDGVRHPHATFSEIAISVLAARRRLPV